MKRIAAIVCALVLVLLQSAGCDGGMDGAGCFAAPSLRLDQDVFVQGLWQDEHFSYVVFNRRREDVQMTVAWRECTPAKGCQKVKEAWSVRAEAAQRFDADRLVSPQASGGPSWTFADGTLLGAQSVFSPHELAQRSVVSVDMDMTGASTFGQVETDLVEVPGPSFTLSLLVPRPSPQWRTPEAAARPVHLLLGPRNAPDLIDWLDVVNARSDLGIVSRQGHDVVVELPPTTGDDLIGGDLPRPFRLEVDVVVPQATQNKVVVGFYAFLCYDGHPEDCQSGISMTRLFPLRNVD